MARGISGGGGADGENARYGGEIAHACTVRYWNRKEDFPLEFEIGVR